MSTARSISVAFRIASGCKRYEDDEEEEDGDDDEWRVVSGERALSSIDQSSGGGEGGGENQSNHKSLETERSSSLCSFEDGWMDRWTNR